MKAKKKSGQVLILVLLVVVVSLAIGLSVASRNLANLKISTQTEQSQRAYTVAENGVEKVLANLNTIKNDPTVAAGTYTTVTSPDSAGAIGTATVASKTTYERQIPLGEVGQVDLITGVGGKYNVMWAKKSSINECVKPASLEVTLVYTDASGNYQQRRWYLTGATGVTGRSESPALVTADSAGSNLTFTYNAAAYQLASVCATSGVTPPTMNPSCPALYVDCAIIDTSISGVVPAGGLRKLLRIRPLWTDTTVNISSNGGSLGIQEYVISSTSSVGNGVTRKLLVQKSALPSVPAVFDFALFSETNITK